MFTQTVIKHKVFLFLAYIGRLGIRKWLCAMDCVNNQAVLLVRRNMKKTNSLRYIAYVRKSEERKERQELSHPAQIRKIKEQFSDLNIVKWMDSESQSAFKPGRPLFNQMMDMIEAGQADAIVGYHPNRISRNEHDSARVTYDLRGPLKDLRFCTYNFDNSPEGIMMLQMVMNQGQYESSKQGIVVKRGMEEKAMGGERPGVVPLGYMKVPTSDVNGNMIIKKDKIVTHTENDPDRFEQVKRMWRMLVYENYTPSQIRKIAHEQWAFTTKPSKHETKIKKMGGGPIGLSSIYRVFTNPFYAGYITHNGELYEGHHNPMITLKEFDYAQKLLKVKGKPRIGHVNDHPYGSIMICGECGCQIVAKTTTKHIKSTDSLKTYVHYFCTRRSLNRPCKQVRYTTIEYLEEQVDAELAKFTIIPEFYEIALKVLRRQHKNEVRDRTTLYRDQQKRRNEIQQQIDELVDMRTRSLLDDEEYKLNRNKLKLKLGALDEDLHNTEARASDWLKQAEDIFDFAAHARERLATTKDPKVKRDILLGLGENFVLTDNQLTFTPHQWFVDMEKSYPPLHRAFERVRTDKKATSQEREAAIALIFDKWRARRDLNPRHPA